MVYNYEENEELTISLNLANPKDRFLSLYPVPRESKKNNVTWNLVFKGNETLQFAENHKLYPYLFWESCDNNNVIVLKEFVCVRNEEVEEKLDAILESKGLNYKERCDMITYWLAELKASEFVKIGFLDEKLYNQYFPLEVTPLPKNMLRVFMLFENCEFEEKSTVLSGRFLENKQFNRNGPTIIEWGGMNMI